VDDEDEDSESGSGSGPDPERRSEGEDEVDDQDDQGDQGDGLSEDQDGDSVVDGGDEEVASKVVVEDSDSESDGYESPRPIPTKSHPKPKTNPKRSKKDKKLKQERKLLKRQYKLAQLKKKLGSKKRSKKKSKKRHLSSDSSESSSSSSSSSDSEDSPPPPKRSKGRHVPPPSVPVPVDQSAMVAQIMEAMKSFQQESQQAIEERMKRLEEASVGLPKETLPSKEVPSLSGGSKSVPSRDESKRPSSRDSDSDEEPSEVRTSLASHTKRRDTMKQYLTDQSIFNFNVPPVSLQGACAQAQFGHAAPVPQTEVVIVQKGMVEELGKHSQKRLAKGFKKPDKLLNKMYRCPLAQNKNWSEPPGINPNLQNIVEHTHKHYDPKKKLWSLNQKHSSGKEEQKLLPIIARQQLVLKIINCATGLWPLS
jgi:hypothetical protein